MTIEEKRKKLDEFCDSQICCSACPHKNNKFCDDDSIDFAEDDVIERWYELFFGAEEEPHIKDSGARTEFPSGGVRDIQKGKGRCDLMPLDVVSDVYMMQNGRDCHQQIVFGQLFMFTSTGDCGHLHDVLGVAVDRMFCDCQTMLLEVSKHFEEGAEKYGENNWQKGLPVKCYINSAVRHYLKWLRGDKDEPHDRAFCWNVICAIWTCKHKPELNDYGKTTCPVCGNAIPKDAEECPICRTCVGEPVNTCRECGKPIKGHLQHCDTCWENLHGG